MKLALLAFLLHAKLLASTVIEDGLGKCWPAADVANLPINDKVVICCSQVLLYILSRDKLFELLKIFNGNQQVTLVLLASLITCKS